MRASSNTSSRPIRMGNSSTPAARKIRVPVSSLCETCQTVSLPRVHLCELQGITSLQLEKPSRWHSQHPSTPGQKYNSWVCMWHGILSAVASQSLCWTGECQALPTVALTSLPEEMHPTAQSHLAQAQLHVLRLAHHQAAKDLFWAPEFSPSGGHKRYPGTFVQTPHRFPLDLKD